MYPSVYTVIVSYNTRDLTMRCIESLKNVKYPTHSIVVVDNGSSDGSEDVIRATYRDVTVIQTHNNLGYTGGNNIGIIHALSTKSDYVLILNPDTIVINYHFITEMVAYLSENSDVGIVGPRVFLREFGNIQNTVLFEPSLKRNIENWFRFRIDPEFAHLSKDNIVEAEVLNGVCLLIRSQCLREIGLFDDNIFMYIEDIDMQHRARANGWRIQYLPINSIIHVQKETGYNMISNVSFLLKRNSVYFLNKIGKKFDAIGFAILSIGLVLMRAVIPLNREGESFSSYIRFTKRLIHSYIAIFEGCKPNKNFGPPYC